MAKDEKTKKKKIKKKEENSIFDVNRAEKE